MNRTSYMNDQAFKLFAVSLESAIKRYAQKDDEALLKRQKRQMDQLVDLERQFRDSLIDGKFGLTTYLRFVNFICVEVGNILVSRPYFRERKEVFNRSISKAFKARDITALYAFRINYQFIQFVLNSRKWGKSSKLVLLVNEIEKIRTELLLENMPLAISRSRIFWSKTPHSHLDYMDLIQISAEGLMIAIDKFVPPFGKVFRAVAVGRISGNQIRDYSSTLVHFWPTDQKKIYRANKLSLKVSQGMSQEDMVDLINEGITPAQKTSISEISNLMAAASTVSAESQSPNTGSSSSDTEISNFTTMSLSAIPEEKQPDNIIESNQAYKIMEHSMHELSPYERKILKLKGIELEENEYVCR